MDELKPTTTGHVPTPEPERRPYTPPQLVEYGDLSELTQGGGGGGQDMLAAPSNMP